MGSQQRKEQEKEDLRRKVITAATELFREESYAAVSMRKIAKRVEYSVGTLYLYYKDKDELFLAVQSAAFEQAFTFINALSGKDDPLERLQELGERYVRFGMKNPDLYRLMFMMEHPMDAMEEGDPWHSGIALHNLLTSLVKECVAAGRIVAEDPDRLSFALWSLVHGMVSLRISQRLTIYNGGHLNCPLCGIDTDQLVIETNEMMISILERQKN
ncbi:MAG: AcrR family transcriptional regulator [Neolewinella sp.]|jgi:AcrR family transcriptional regulator